MPWARPGARFTRDLEAVVAYLAQRTTRPPLPAAALLVAAVAAITVRVVADQVDDHRLDGLYRIGIDEVAYRKGHRYLTVVADHDRNGAVVWAAEGKCGATLERFYDALGAERAAQLTAASMDLHGAYARVTCARAPQARSAPTPSTSSSSPTTHWTRSDAPRQPPRSHVVRPSLVSGWAAAAEEGGDPTHPALDGAGRAVGQPPLERRPDSLDRIAVKAIAAPCGTTSRGRTAGHLAEHFAGQPAEQAGRGWRTRRGTHLGGGRIGRVS